MNSVATATMSAEDRIEGLANGSLKYYFAGRHYPTQINKPQRARFEIARTVGFLTARTADKPLRALWARRSDILELPDIVVFERPKLCVVKYDIIQTGKGFAAPTLVAMRAWIAQFGRPELYEVIGGVRALSPANAQIVAGYILSTFETQAQPRGTRP